MPAKSGAQQKAAGAALSAKRGKTPKSKLQGAARSMVELMDETANSSAMAATKRKGKPEHAAKDKIGGRPPPALPPRWRMIGALRRVGATPGRKAPPGRQLFHDHRHRPARPRRLPRPRHDLARDRAARPWASRTSSRCSIAPRPSRWRAGSPTPISSSPTRRRCARPRSTGPGGCG